MPVRSTFSVSLVVLLVLALSGCVRNGPNDTTTPTPTPETNACTPYKAPRIEATAGLRGENAFQYVVGLVCDHSGASPKERARVPGTPAQAAGAAYLYDALRSTSFSVSVDNFTGAQYEALVKAKPNSQAHSYYANPSFCSAEDKARLGTLQFSNVVARGGTLGGPILFLLAHWDSKRFATEEPDPEKRTRPVLGANDGASGVGVLLEFARTLKATDTSWEVRILLDDGEDGFEDCHPLAGTMWDAENLLDSEAERIKAIVLLDMVGDPKTKFYKGCGNDGALQDRIWSIAHELGISQFIDDRSCSVTDDHKPYEERGLAAVDVIAYPPFPPYWHTASDIPANLSPDFLGNVGQVVRRTLDQLDDLPVLPERKPTQRMLSQ